MQAVKDPDCERKETFEHMVAEWQLPLLRLCFVQLHDKAMAEDAVQETFLKAYRGLDAFRGESSVKTWLTRIAINTCRGYAARRLVQAYGPPCDAGYASGDGSPAKGGSD